MPFAVPLSTVHLQGGHLVAAQVTPRPPGPGGEPTRRGGSRGGADKSGTPVQTGMDGDARSADWWIRTATAGLT